MSAVILTYDCKICNLFTIIVGICLNNYFEQKHNEEFSRKHAISIFVNLRYFRFKLLKYRKYDMKIRDTFSS